MHQNQKVTKEELVYEFISKEELIYDDNEVYMKYTSSVTDESEIYLLGTQEAYDFIRIKLYEEHSCIVSERELHAGLSIAIAKARINRNNQKVYKRFGFANGCYYIDLCNKKKEVVVIKQNTWEIQNSSDCLFYRPKHFQEIPVPINNATSPWDIFDFINVANQEDKLKILAWVTSLIRVDIQRPILSLTGSPGSAKTTCARILRMLYDPVLALEVDVPIKEDEFALAFYHNQVPFFDNASSFNIKTSDMFCKVVTGGAFTKRKLYTDSELLHFAYKRPVIMTSLEIPSNQTDFHRRMLHIQLEPISKRNLQSEKELMERFHDRRSELLGALLSLTSKALMQLPLIELDEKSSMPDFDYWGSAICKVLDIDHAAFIKSRLKPVALVVQDDKAFNTAEALRTFAQKNTDWEGTMTQLLNEIKMYSDNERDFPQNSVSLGKMRNTLNELLESDGIAIVKANYKNHQQNFKFEILNVDSIEHEPVKDDIQRITTSFKKSLSELRTLQESVKNADSSNTEDYSYKSVFF